MQWNRELRRVGEKIKEEAAATEKQKGKCGIKQLGVLWVGTPIDEAKVDLSVLVLRPVPLVRHLKYATHPRTSLSSNIFFLGSTAAARVILNLIVSTGPGATSTRVRGRSCECTSPEWVQARGNFALASPVFWPIKVSGCPGAVVQIYVWLCCME